MTAVAQFMEKLSSDEAMLKDLIARVDAFDGDNANPAVAAFAKEHGYAVSEVDITKAQSAIVEALDEEGELSDEAMENVSGGIAVTTTVALIGLAGVALTAAGGVGAAGMTAAGAVGVAAINNIDKVGDFFKKW